MDKYMEIEKQIIELKEMDLTNSIALLGLIELLCAKKMITHSELSKYAEAIKSQLLSDKSANQA